MEKKQREREAEEQEQQKQPEVIEVDDEYDEEDRAAFAEASYKKAIQLQTQEAYDAAGLMGIDVSEMEESEVVEMMSSRYMTRSKTTPKKVSRIPFTELDPKELHQRDVEEEERKGKGPGKGKGKGKSSKKIQETEKKKEREEEDVKPNIKIVEDTPVTVMPEIVGDTMLITQTDRFKLRTRPRKTYEELVEEIHRDEADRDPLVYEIESAQEIKVHTPMKTEKDDKKKKDDLEESIAIVKPPEVVFENIKKFRAFTSDESTQEITTQESSDDKSKDTITTVESTEDDEEDHRQREEEEFRVARMNFRESARQYDQREKLKELKIKKEQEERQKKEKLGLRYMERMLERQPRKQVTPRKTRGKEEEAKARRKAIADRLKVQLIKKEKIDEASDDESDDNGRLI